MNTIGNNKMLKHRIEALTASLNAIDKRNFEIQTRKFFFGALIVTLTSLILCKTTWPYSSNFDKVAILGLGLLMIRFLAVLLILRNRTLLFVLMTLPLILITSLNVIEKTYVLYPYFFAVSAYNISFKKIIRYFFFINFAIFVLTISASSLGIIENLIRDRDVADVIGIISQDDETTTGTNKLRLAFGYNYPTDFAAHIFYMVLMWILLRLKKIKWAECIIFLMASVFVYTYCDARLDTICILLATLLAFVPKFVDGKPLNLFFRFVLSYSVVLFACLMFILTYLYMVGNSDFIEIMNLLLSSRLKLGAEALEKYGIKLLGQNYVVYAGEDPLTFNFLDCSYILLLIVYGLFFFFFSLFCYVRLSRTCVQNRQYFLPIIIFLVAIHSSIFQGFMNFQFSPFYLGAFALNDIMSFPNRREKDAII